MMINNNHKRNFNELNWYDPTTWFGQPSIPPPEFTGVSTAYTATGPDFFGKNKSTDNSFDSAIKSNFVAPFQNVEKGAVKIEDNIIGVAKALENDTGKVG